MSISPANPEDYSKALAKLRQTDPIASKQLFDLIGQTSEGNVVFLPGSYEKGYRDSLLPRQQRPFYVVNLGIIGQLSDGTWVFPPSYDSGMNRGSNDLRFAILAEGQMRLVQRNQELERSFALMQEEFDRLKKKSEKGNA
jgi:hypothetical protein